MERKIDWLNILERAAWTFVEGALLSLPTAFSLELDGAAWKAMLFTALLAGLSALKTFILEVIHTYKDSGK